MKPMALSSVSCFLFVFSVYKAHFNGKFSVNEGIFKNTFMLKLFLLRHAKSSWDNHKLDDKERPLSKSGINSCIKLAGYIDAKALYPDQIICSNAKRAKQTVKIIMDNLKNKNKKIEVSYTSKIYLKGFDSIINLILKAGSNVKSLLIAGHNPDMENITEFFTNKDFPYQKFSTAGFALIEFNINSWSRIKDCKGELKFFVNPKML